MYRSVDGGCLSSYDLDIQEKAKSSHKQTVLLVASDHVASVGLRTLLQDIGCVRVVAEVVHGTFAIRAAAIHQPECVIVAIDNLTAHCNNLITELHTASDQSRLLVFTDSLDQELQLELSQIPIAGYIDWRHATRDIIQKTLELTQAGLCVISAEAADALVAGLGTTCYAQRSGVFLKDSQRQVMVGLALGLSQGKIAYRERIGLRTEQRIEQELARMLETDKRPGLIRRAQELGF